MTLVAAAVGEAEMTSDSGFTHDPVLKDEVLAWLLTDPAGVYLDATLGLGGHSEAILKTISAQGRLIGTDMDPEALELSRRRLAPFAGRTRLVHANFRNLGQVLASEPPLAGALFDLGVSSLQLEKASRGFSIQRDGPLDMRLDPSSPLTAARILNEWPPEQIALLLREFGEEREADRIALWIVQARRERPFATTGQLRELLEARLRRVGGARIHPATRTFMGLRIAVNSELENLTRGLEEVLPRLVPGGRVAVISFHSLEDRIVKNLFKSIEAQGRLRSLTRSPVVPGPAEVASNPRARSAKLRVAEMKP